MIIIIFINIIIVYLFIIFFLNYFSKLFVALNLMWPLTPQARKKFRVQNTSRKVGALMIYEALYSRNVKTSST